jgi:hypothetical protein
MRGDLHPHIRRDSDPPVALEIRNILHLTKVRNGRDLSNPLSFALPGGAGMARHNREGTGQDQLGRSYVVSYQPDWFYQVKVTRDLESGRQSTKTLFRNPDPPQADPGPRVRTRIESKELGLSFEVTVEDPRGIVRRITVETAPLEGGQAIGFTVSRIRPRRSGS